MVKIAVEMEQALRRRDAHGGRGRTTSRVLAQGDGWTVADAMCTSGPHDRRFEEQHSDVSIDIVTAGSFQYRASSPHHSGAAGELMTPGSLLLGNPGQYFECGHEHGAGDRCIAFHYVPDYFERIAGDAGASSGKVDFHTLRLPPLRAFSPLIARACASVIGRGNMPWEEIAIQLAARTVQIARGIFSGPTDAPPSAVARVTRTVRMIERHPDAGLTLAHLAREAGLTPYHFLRTFQRLTGVTPHQYILRARLREAAIWLAMGSAKILDIALDCGFGDVSNFNRGFHGEFGVSPRAYRLQKSL